jgi:hypothetical protein
MSEQEKSPWEKVLDEISNPWDWVTATLGAACGALISTEWLTELGTSLATGALIGIAARKALYVSLLGKRLKRRAAGLQAELEEAAQRLNHLTLKNLLEQLARERRLWQRKAISDEEFNKQLNDLIDQYRSQELARLTATQAPNPLLSTPPANVPPVPDDKPSA